MTKDLFTRAPADPPQKLPARAKRQARARWQFYGKLGSLRLAESVLRAIHSEYACRPTGGTGHVIEVPLAKAISDALGAVHKIRVKLIADHANDWRETP